MKWLYKLSFVIAALVAIAGVILIVLSFVAPKLFSAALFTGLILVVTGVFVYGINYYFYKMFKDFPKVKGYDVSMKSSASRMSSAAEYLKEQNRSNKLASIGKPIRVKIINVVDTGQIVQNDAVLNFNVEVLNERRYDNYNINDYKQVVSKIIAPRILPGNEYPAKVDPNDKNNIFISWI